MLAAARSADLASEPASNRRRNLDLVPRRHGDTPRRRVASITEHAVVGASADSGARSGRDGKKLGVSRVRRKGQGVNVRGGQQPMGVEQAPDL